MTTLTTDDDIGDAIKISRDRSVSFASYACFSSGVILHALSKRFRRKFGYINLPKTLRHWPNKMPASKNFCLKNFLGMLLRQRPIYMPSLCISSCSFLSCVQNRGKHLFAQHLRETECRQRRTLVCHTAST